MADDDFALALSLQDDFSALDNEKWMNFGEKRKRVTSIVDDCWETIDPTPDIRDLFLQFNEQYFSRKAVVLRSEMGTQDDTVSLSI